MSRIEDLYDSVIKVVESGGGYRKSNAMQKLKTIKIPLFDPNELNVFIEIAIEYIEKQMAVMEPYGYNVFCLISPNDVNIVNIGAHFSYLNTNDLNKILNSVISKINRPVETTLPSDSVCRFVDYDIIRDTVEIKSQCDYRVSTMFMFDALTSLESVYLINFKKSVENSYYYLKPINIKPKVFKNIKEDFQEGDSLFFNIYYNNEVFWCTYNETTCTIRLETNYHLSKNQLDDIVYTNFKKIPYYSDLTYRIYNQTVILKAVTEKAVYNHYIYLTLILYINQMKHFYVNDNRSDSKTFIETTNFSLKYVNPHKKESVVYIVNQNMSRYHTLNKNLNHYSIHTCIYYENDEPMSTAIDVFKKNFINLLSMSGSTVVDQLISTLKIKKKIKTEGYVFFNRTDENILFNAGYNDKKNTQTIENRPVFLLEKMHLELGTDDDLWYADNQKFSVVHKESIKPRIPFDINGSENKIYLMSMNNNKTQIRYVRTEQSVSPLTSRTYRQHVELKNDVRKTTNSEYLRHIFSSHSIKFSDITEYNVNLLNLLDNVTTTNVTIKRELYNLCRQEMFDYTEEEIEKHINQHGFSTRLHINFLSNVFKLNIYVLIYSEKTKAFYFETPRYSKFSIFTHNYDYPTIVIIKKEDKNAYALVCFEIDEGDETMVIPTSMNNDPFVLNLIKLRKSSARTYNTKVLHHVKIKNHTYSKEKFEKLFVNNETIKYRVNIMVTGQVLNDEGRLDYLFFSYVSKSIEIKFFLKINSLVLPLGVRCLDRTSVRAINEHTKNILTELYKDSPLIEFNKDDIKVTCDDIVLTNKFSANNDENFYANNYDLIKKRQSILDYYLSVTTWLIYYYHFLINANKLNVVYGKKETPISIVTDKLLCLPIDTSQINDSVYTATIFKKIYDYACMMIPNFYVYDSESASLVVNTFFEKNYVCNFVDVEIRCMIDILSTRDVTNPYCHVMYDTIDTIWRPKYDLDRNITNSVSLYKKRMKSYIAKMRLDNYNSIPVFTEETKKKSLMSHLPSFIYYNTRMYYVTDTTDTEQIKDEVHLDTFLNSTVELDRFILLFDNKKKVVISENI